MGRLVELVQEKDPSSKQYSFSLKILMNLTEQENARPSVGNAGGITLFLSLLNEDSRGGKKVPLLNALCLFCTDAVNRVRIRELGILDVLHKALRDENLAIIHGRIVGAFVCFIYDDPSLNHLLSTGLIGTLLEHLQSSAGFRSTQNEQLRDGIEAKSQDDSLTVKRGIQSPDSVKGPGKRRKVDAEDGENQDKLLVGSGNDEVFKPEDEKDGSGSKTDLKSPGAEEGAKEGSARRQHVYSIDSPTYEPQYFEWSLNDFKSSIKCKQSFSPDSLHSVSSSPDRQSVTASPSYPETYSPLSVTSYHSPDYSPQYSPSYQAYLTPVSSPMGASVGSPVGSPQRCSSPSELSDTKEQISAGIDDGGKAWEYSSDEESCEESESRSSAVHASVIEHSKDTQDSSDQPSVPGVPRETGNSQAKRNLHKSLDISSSESKSDSSKNAKIATSSQLEKKTGKPVKKEVASSSEKRLRKKSPVCKITEKNILIFLSRVSQMPDPSKFLVSEECVCVLLDYISLSKEPSDRAGRILKRMFKNPHCLEPLLDVLAPVHVLDKLCSRDLDEQMNETVTPKSAPISKGEKQGRRTSSVSEPEDIPDPACLSASALAATLMQDLSFVVESPYGRGTVAHVLRRKPDAQKTRCVLSLPFLCR